MQIQTSSEMTVTNELYESYDHSPEILDFFLTLNEFNSVYELELSFE